MRNVIDPKQASLSKRIRYVSFLLAFVIVLAACAGGGDEPSAQEPTSTPIPTAPAVARPRYTVQRGTVQESLEFTGRWQPRDQLELSFEVDGTVRRVEVRRDDTVNVGQLLADLQIEQLEEQLQDAQISLENAQNALESESEGTTQSIESAELQVFNAQLALQRHLDSPPTNSVRNALDAIDQAEHRLENAHINYNEAISEHGAGGANAVDSAYEELISAQDALDDARFSYTESATSAGSAWTSWENTRIDRENDLVLAQQDLDRARQNATDGSGDLRSQQLTIERLQQDIARSTLISTIDGVVLEVNVQPGDSVQAFSGVITIGVPEPLEAIANIPIGDAQRLSIGLVGVCQAINEPETAVQCAVRQIPASARDADQTTRIAASLGDIPQGTIIQVTMPLQVRENTLWLPPAAIRTFQNRTFVVLETPDGPRSIDVQIGLQTDDRVEILAGVEEGDVVQGP
jgi:multidrug efflux pump subunit AcrA (membrane-fusion protein)